MWRGLQHPHAEVSSPFGVHLYPATKENIWRGEYVDLFSLLFRELEPKLWAGFGAVALELEQ